MTTHTLRQKPSFLGIADADLTSNAVIADARRRQRRRRVITGSTAAAVVIASTAFLAIYVFPLGHHSSARIVFGTPTPAQESQGLVHGEAIFRGTNPTCTRVNAHEFHCVLSSVPTGEISLGSYLGTKMGSVDSSKHVNGGCVATSADGMEWECYIGHAAVEHGILDQTVLGHYQPAPGHG
jgi:hypothetical protein